MIFDRRVPFHLRISYYYDSQAGFFFGLFSGLTLSFISVVARRMGASTIQMASITSAPCVGLLLTFLWVYYSAGKKKMAILYWPKVVARSLFFLMPLVHTPSFYVGIFAVSSILETVGNPVYSGIVKEIYPDKHRGKTMGYVKVVMSISIIFASFIGGRLLDVWGDNGFRYLFPIGAVFGIIGISTFRKIKIKGEKIFRRKKPQFFEFFREWFKDKVLLYLACVIFVAGFGNLMLGPLCPIFLIDHLNVSLLFVGILSALSSFSSIIAYYYCGRFVDRKNPLLILRIIFLLVSFIPLLYFWGNRWGILLAAIIGGFSIGGWDITWFQYVTRRSSPEDIQAHVGLFYNLMGIRGIIAPFIAVNLINKIGLRFSFLVPFAVIFSGFILMIIFEKYEAKIAKEKGE